jgi:hypothetical protein
MQVLNKVGNVYTIATENTGLFSLHEEDYLISCSLITGPDDNSAISQNTCIIPIIHFVIYL